MPKTIFITWRPTPWPERESAGADPAMAAA
jgi:hypothetical protein